MPRVHNFLQLKLPLFKLIFGLELQFLRPQFLGMNREYSGGSEPAATMTLLYSAIALGISW